jgi:hypothetical protein
MFGNVLTVGEGDFSFSADLVRLVSKATREKTRDLEKKSNIIVNNRSVEKINKTLGSVLAGTVGDEEKRTNRSPHDDSSSFTASSFRLLATTLDSPTELARLFPAAPSHVASILKTGCSGGGDASTAADESSTAAADGGSDVGTAITATGVKGTGKEEEEEEGGGGWARVAFRVDATNLEASPEVKGYHPR